MNPKQQTSRSLERFQRLAKMDVQKRMKATAADIKKEIQRSLKSGGKNRFSQTYQRSKPGEPPRTHGRRLKQSIRYEIAEKKIRVGAPSLGGSKTAKILEEGGDGKLTETKTTDAYFKRRKARATQQAREARKARATTNQTPTQEKPKAKRAYTIQSDSGAHRRITRYERFQTPESARRAASSAQFQAWRAKIQKTTTTSLKIAPRPYVTPSALSQLRRLDLKNQ